MDMNVNDLIDFIAQQGRYGDTMLAHISPAEAKLLKQAGGSGTINPKTGLPEFFGLKSLTKPLKKLGKGAMDVVSTPFNWAGDISESVGLPSWMGKAALGAGLGYAVAPYLSGATATAPASAVPAGANIPSLAGIDIGAGIGGTMDLPSVAAGAGITGAMPLIEGGGVSNMTPATSASIAPFTAAEARAAVAAGLMTESEAAAQLAASAGAGVIPTASAGGATNLWDSITGFADKHPYITAGAALTGANVLSSKIQADMMKDVSKAQQKSYDDYLGAINPSEEVKRTRFEKLASDARAQGVLARKKIADLQAARGVRGKGTLAATGDEAEIERKAINDAYNMIYGTYNVPGAPGPASYSPTGGQLGAANISQMMAQGIPLALILSKYGVG